MFQFPPFRGFVKIFVIACVGMFILQMIATKTLPLVGPGIDQISYYLGLVPERFLQGHFYALFTWVFLHSTDMIFHILFNMLGLWMFGAMIQEELGDKRFGLFCLFGTLVSGGAVVVGSLWNEASFISPTIGASGIVFATLVGYARIHPNQTVIFYIFPMKIKYLAALLVLVDAFFMASGKDGNVSYVAHLAGAAYGFFAIRIFLGHGGMGGGWLQKVTESLSQKKKKRHLRIVYPDEQDQRRTYH